MVLTNEITIPIWANGPDSSANGGYAAGLIAEAAGLGFSAEVNLRLPPPLGTKLELLKTDSGFSVVDATDTTKLVATVAQAETTTLDLPLGIEKLTLDLAKQASASFPYKDDHPFATCLCCGTRRDNKTPQLGIHCGNVQETSIYADTWLPSSDFSDHKDPSLVSIPACWSSLDCPSAAPFAAPDKPAVLARISVQINEQPKIGENYILAAWEINRDGRKLTSSSALLNQSGFVLAYAKALWIEVKSI